MSVEDRNCEFNVMPLNSHEMCCSEKEQIRRDMADQIRSLEFAITELALYLDTHPDEAKALCLHRKYAKELKELKDEYQKVYGPLTIHFPCNKWRWLEEPWGSFILGYV